MYEDSYLDASHEDRYELDFEPTSTYMDWYEEEATEFWDDEPDIYAGTYSED